MHTRPALSFIVLGGLLFAVPAQAHIRLEGPKDSIETDAQGDPQKTGQCGGAGKATNIVTKVKAGSKLKVMWTETIPHEGHFRVSLSKDRSAFKDPRPADVAQPCKSAIEATPKAPTVADGLFVHGRSATGTPYVTEITVPSEPTDKITMQVIQVMTDRTSNCFYYHCADLQIVSDLDGGTEEVKLDAGNSGSSGQTGSEKDDENDATPATSTRRSSTPADDGGCGVGSQPVSSYAAFGLVAMAGISLLRRRRTGS